MTTMLGNRPVLMLATIGAAALIACCALFGGDAIADGVQTAIAVSR